VRLSGLIDWKRFDEAFGELYAEGSRLALRAPASGGFGLDPLRTPVRLAFMRSARSAARAARRPIRQRLALAGSRSGCAPAWCSG
jgi:hypothetical protein